jgi:hypothetical protein
VVLKVAVISIAWFDLRRDREFVDVLEVIGDPVDQLVTVTTKFVGGHIAERG